MLCQKNVGKYNLDECTCHIIKHDSHAHPSSIVISCHLLHKSCVIQRSVFMPVTNPYGTSTCRPRFASGFMSVINNSRKQSTKRPTAPSPIVLPSQSTIALTVVWLPTMNASFARFASSSGKGRCETFFTPLKSLLPRFNSYAAHKTFTHFTRICN